MNPTFAPVPFEPLSGCTYEKCTTESSCNVVNVEPFSSETNYQAEDIVRVGAIKFKCRSFPNEGWCNNSAYQPTLETGIWADAWEMVGMCKRTVSTSLKVKSTLILSVDGSCPQSDSEIQQAKSSIEAATREVIEASLVEGQSLASVAVTSFACEAATRRRLDSGLRKLQTSSTITAETERVLEQVCIGEECLKGPAMAKDFSDQVNDAVEESVQSGEYTEALKSAGLVATAEDATWGVSTECTTTAGGGSDGAVSETSPCEYSMVGVRFFV